MGKKGDGASGVADISLPCPSSLYLHTDRWTKANKTFQLNTFAMLGSPLLAEASSRKRTYAYSIHPSVLKDDSLIKSL